ncbi:MAG: DNA internalization-related competence protein ComEC/Rec2, partial [Nitrospirae bacterium]|nr:DNA internalization-related competence protein ComEC/Rec2 [Nitrospirota bacterium]
GNIFGFYPILTLTVLALLFLTEHFFTPLRVPFFHTVLLALFFWGGFLSVEWTQFHIPKNDVSKWIGRKIIYTGTIDEAVSHFPDHTTLILKTEKIETDHQEFSASGKIKLGINRPVETALAYGDQIKVPLTLREPHGFKNINSFDYGEYLARHGFRATASLTRSDNLLVTGKTGGIPVFRTIYQWREEIREKAVRTLKGDGLAVFLAMVIGESGYLNNPLRDVFMASGTTHILSISGSHLALVALLVFSAVRFFLLRLPEPALLRLGKTILPSRLALWLSIPPVLLYGLLAGNQVATNRSIIMIVTFLIGNLLNREQNLFNPLGLSALAILLFDPLQVFDLSFQLSFGSVLSIALVLDRIHQKPRPSPEERPSLNIRFFKHPRILKWAENIKNYLWISLGTTLGTAPLVAYHFNQFNWVGLIANSIIIPMAGLIIVPLALLSSFLSLLTGAPLLYFGSLNQAFLDLFIKTEVLFASFPLAELHLASPSPFYLILFYALILMLLYFRVNVRIRAFALTLVFLLPLWWYFGPKIPLHSKELRITILDVGQGDASFIEFPDGKNMLIDGGGLYHEFDAGRLAVAPFLWNRGVSHIDYLVATHPQADHIGGLIYILKKFSIGEVWTNGTVKETRISTDFEKMIKKYGFIEKIVREGDRFKEGESDLSVLNPHLKNRGGSSFNAQENNDGIVLKIDYGRQSALFAADIEKEAEEAILEEHPAMKITLLKVPHHGGKGSALPAFVQTLSPEISVFSAGAHNPYHHPHPDTLLLYQSLNTRIYRTDQDGGVIFKTDGERFREMSALSITPIKVSFGKEALKTEFDNLSKLLRRS